MQPWQYSAQQWENGQQWENDVLDFRKRKTVKREKERMRAEAKKANPHLTGYQLMLQAIQTAVEAGKYFSAPGPQATSNYYDWGAGPIRASARAGSELLKST